MNKKIKIPNDMKTGSIHKTNSCGDLIVDKYLGVHNVLVRFKNTGTKKSAQADDIRKGKVKDLFYPSVFGVGFLGGNKYKTDHSSHKTWEGMIKRCYRVKSQKERPTYKDCTVHSEWHNFQNFARWYEENHPSDGGKYQLDKDFLFIGNKEYSSINSIFVPVWMNSFTLNCKSARGDHPIGVSFDKRKELFLSSCKNECKAKFLGYFSTPENAHLAWRKYKLQLALDKKPEMDAIDLRIYPNVVQIITEAR